MSVSSPFIRRPIATSLLGFAVTLGGALGYWWLPVSSLPQVDFPTIQVTTQLPGANPETTANLVTAPLERQLGQIPALATHDVVVVLRHQPDHAAVRRSTATSMPPRRTCSRPSTPPARRCRATCPIRRPTPR